MSRSIIDEVVRPLTRFLKDQIGHGPGGYRAYLIDDMLIIRLFKNLTRVEYEMAKTPEGRKFVKDARDRMMGEFLPALRTVIQEVTGAEVIAVHTSVSTRTGEQILAIVLDRKLRVPPEGPVAFA